MVKSAMVNFNIEKYYYLSFTPYNTSVRRKRARGFTPAIASLLDRYYNKKFNLGAFLEIGISGGGAHSTYTQCLLDPIKIFGVELSDPNSVSSDNAKAYDKTIQGYSEAINVMKDHPGKVFFEWGMDGYSSGTAAHFFAKNNNEKFGIIINDGYTRGISDLNHWKPYLDNPGYIIDECPFGTGEAVWDVYQDPDRLKEALRKSSELNNTVIFDFNEFMTDYPAASGRPEIEFPIGYLGVYCKNWKNVLDSTTAKFLSKFIVEGEQYFNLETRNG